MTGAALRFSAITTARLVVLWVLLSGLTSRASAAADAPKLLSEHFEVATRCSDWSCMHHVSIRTARGAERQVAVGFGGSYPVASYDGLRCLVNGEVDKDLAPDGGDRRGIWLLDSAGTARRLRQDKDVNHAATSLLPRPSNGILQYVATEGCDPRGWIRAATTEGVDTLWALIGGSAAHRVAMFGTAPEVDRLAEEGADLVSRNAAAMTPLELAIVSGNEAVAAGLCSRGVAREDSASRARQWALDLGRHETLRALRADGVDLTTTDSTGSLLHRAVASRFVLVGDPRRMVRPFAFVHEERVSAANYRSCVRVLLELGADVRAADRYGSTALHKLADAYVPALLRRSDATPEGALRAEIATLLLDAGADPGAKDRLGRTALHHLVFPGHPEVSRPMMRVLVQRGANVDAIDAQGKTPLQHLFSFYDDSAKKRVARALGLPPDAPIVMAGGDHPDARTIEIAATLIALGARPDVPQTNRRAVERRVRSLSSVDRGR